MSNDTPPDPWQVIVGKYLIDHLPTIIAAIFLGVGGCYTAKHLSEGQQQLQQQVEEHGAVQQEIKKAVEQKP